jgi:hypothetical protein
MYVEACKRRFEAERRERRRPALADTERSRVQELDVAVAGPVRKLART